MASIGRNAVGRFGRAGRQASSGAVRYCPWWLLLAACGGQAAEENAAGGGGQVNTVGPGQGGQTSTATTARGGTTSTATTSTVAATCYGEPDTPTVAGCYTIDIAAFDASNTACLMMLQILPNYMLNPAKLKLYFTASDGTRSVIPYVGKLADCASRTTFGGWYATNIAGGSSEIGLCGCTCNAAHRHGFRAEVACDGIPK